jgi:hypothetical protein
MSEVKRYFTHGDLLEWQAGWPKHEHDGNKATVLASAYDAKCAEAEKWKEQVSQWEKQTQGQVWVSNEEYSGLHTTIATLRSQLEQMREYGMKRDSELAFSQSQLQAAQRDAERYRWLRENKLKIEPACMDGPAHPTLHFYWDLWNDHPETHNAAGLDTAIDAAMGEK